MDLQLNNWARLTTSRMWEEGMFEFGFEFELDFELDFESQSSS